MSIRAIVRVFLATVAWMAVPGGQATAEMTQCTVISSVPYVISTSGSYCLQSDLTTSMASGAAISIEANSVLLDLRGHKLGGQAAGPGTVAYGVQANLRRNIVVRNGTIRGFHTAVFLGDNIPYDAGVANVVEDVTAEANTVNGIWLIGRGGVIRRNLVVDTGHSPSAPNHLARAILIVGEGMEIVDNRIVGVHTDTATGQGILVLGHDTIVQGNRISDADVGIAVGGADVLVSDNRLTGVPLGIQFLETSTGKYRDTLTSGVLILATGGTDAGNNQ